jgi:hypothetical protein
MTTSLSPSQCEGIAPTDMFEASASGMYREPSGHSTSAVAFILISPSEDPA